MRESGIIAALRKEPKPSPTESPLLFEIDPQPLEETLTAWGGIPLVVPAFRSLGLPQSGREPGRGKERERGYDEATFGESLVILNAAGGEWAVKPGGVAGRAPDRRAHPARRRLLRLASVADWIAASREGRRLLPLPT